MFVAVIAGVPAPAGAVTPVIDLSSTLEFNDNVARAEVHTQSESDTLWTHQANLALRHRFNEKLGLLISGRLAYTRHFSFTDLNNFQTGFSTGLHFKPFAGYSMPWFALDARGTGLAYEGSRIRDGWKVDLSVSTGKRFTDRLSGRIGWGVDRREGRGHEVFDISGRRVFTGLDFSATRQLTLYSNYAYRDGSVVSTARATTKIIRGSNAIVRDPVFGGLTERPTRFAYQIDAQSHELEVGGNYAISRTVALDARLRYLDTNGRGENNYHGLLGGLSLLWRIK